LHGVTAAAPAGAHPDGSSGGSRSGRTAAAAAGRDL